MPVEQIDSLDDPRVALYRNLKDRELAASGDRFIAEGEHLVRRLLASDFPVDSVMLAQRMVAEIAPIVSPDVPVYAVSDSLVHEIIGYRFHSGVIAVGVRKPSDGIDEVMAGATSQNVNGASLVVVCPEIINADNLGSIMRLCAGFGADALVLGERCCDPFWRRCVRVSMGTVFSLPVVRSNDIVADMKMLRDRWNVELMATVLDAQAEPLESVVRPSRIAVVLGSEPQGLDRRHVAICNRRVTIPMQRGTDSLNVATAAAIFLYHFSRGVPAIQG